MAGDDTDRPDRASATQPVNTVTLADIGRLVAINADLRAGDVSALLTTASEQAFAGVPPDARLQDCPPDSPLYLAATLLYDLFRRPGIGPAKRSKVLHLKRPWLVPIYDSHVHRIYANRAADLARAGRPSADRPPLSGYLMYPGIELPPTRIRPTHRT
jgi:hypothetical protein